MKELVFEEYSAPYKDADGDEHVHVARACVLDKDTYKLGNDQNGRPIPREFEVVGRSERVHATPDMVIVETANPNQYDVHSLDTWKDMGFKTDKAKGPAPK